MGHASSILKNTTILMASSLLSKALGAVIIILLARHLGDAGFGEYSFAFAFVAVFIVISDFGLDALVIRDVSRKRELAGTYLEHIGILRLGLSAVMIIASLAAGFFMGVEQESLVIILFAGIIYAFDKMSGLNFAMFRAFEKMEYEAISQISWRVIQLSILLAAMQMGFSLLEIIMALLLASVMKTVLSFTIVLRLGITPAREGLSTRGIMKKSLGFAAYEIGFAIYSNIIIILLFIYFNFSEIGWFGASYKIFLMLMLIPLSFETAIFPVLSKLHSQQPEKMKVAYAKSMKFSLLVAIPCTFVIFTFSEQITSILGTEFDNTASLLMLMIFALPIRSLNLIMKTALWSADRTDLTVLNMLISTIALLASAVYLIGEFGLDGAVYAFICGEVILFTLNYYFISKKIYKIGKYIWKPVIAGCAMSGIIYFFFMVGESKVGMEYLLLVSLVGYAAVTMMLKTITGYDIQIMKQALSSIRRKNRS